MKRFFSCIIAMAMILSVACVSATTTNQLNASYDATTKKITINGTFEQFTGNITVLVSKHKYTEEGTGVEVTVDSYDDITAENISQNVVQFATWNGEGNLELLVSSSIDAGHYIVFCSAQGFTDVASKVFYITNESEQNSAINAFKTATTGTIATVINDWTVTKPVVTIDLSKPLYTTYKADVEKALAGCIADEVAKLAAASPAGTFDMSSIFTCYERALALVDFNTASDKPSKFQEHATLLEATNGNVTNDNRASIVALMTGQTDAEEGKFFSQSTFNKALNKSVAVYAVNGKSRDDIRAALKANEGIIGIDVDAGYASANESGLNAAMSLGSFTTTEAIKTAFDTAVVNNPKVQGGGSLTGGSLTGGSLTGGSTGSTTIGRPTIDPKPDTEKYPGYVPQKDVFKDISAYTWAKDAIEYLNEKEVLQGDGNGNFEPARNIKREEYAKIIVEAFDLKDNGKVKEFNDVSKDAWHYDYINIAYQNGIINGVNEDSFGTGSLITRQDAAVMIYRYLQEAGYKFSNEFTIDFADIDDCAEYAKSAVKALKNSGLVNGNGDNTFCPKNYLSRAEAAVMIYNIISEVEAK